MPPVLRDLNASRYASAIPHMLAEARRVRSHAYAPYSKFFVGSAVLVATGQVYAGMNVECVDYDGTHAEESAISIMRASSFHQPVLIVTVGAQEGTPEPAPVIVSCGKCRQKIRERTLHDGKLDIDMIVPDPRDGTLKLCSIRELLPLAFSL